MASKSVQKAMRILWEGEGHRWDELNEYPYSAWESKAILARLEKTVNLLQASFPDGIK